MEQNKPVSDKYFCFTHTQFVDLNVHQKFKESYEKERRDLKESVVGGNQVIEYL